MKSVNPITMPSEASIACFYLPEDIDFYCLQTSVGKQLTALSMPLW